MSGKKRCLPVSVLVSWVDTARKGSSEGVVVREVIVVGLFWLSNLSKNVMMWIHLLKICVRAPFAELQNQASLVLWFLVVFMIYGSFILLEEH